MLADWHACLTVMANLNDDPAHTRNEWELRQMARIALKRHPQALASLSGSPTDSGDEEFCPTCGTHRDDVSAHTYPWKAPDGSKTCCPAHWIKKHWPPAPTDSGGLSEEERQEGLLMLAEFRRLCTLRGSQDVIAGQRLRLSKWFIDHADALLSSTPSPAPEDGE